MNRKEIEINNIATMLLECTQEKYEQNKIVLMSYAVVNRKTSLINFLKVLFEFTDGKRPLLIKMKAGAA